MSLQLLVLSGVTAVNLQPQAPDPVATGAEGDVTPGPGLPFAVDYSLVAFNPTASSIQMQESDDNSTWASLGAAIPAYGFGTVVPQRQYIRAGAATADTIYLLGD